MTSLPIGRNQISTRYARSEQIRIRLLRTDTNHLKRLFAVKREFGGSGVAGHAAAAALASRIRRW